MEPFAIRLSHEELSLLLSWLGLRGLAGVPVGTFEQHPSANEVVAHEAITRALLARQFIAPLGEGRYQVESGLSKLLTLCAYPEMALHLTTQTAEQAQPQQEFYYHFGGVTALYYLPYTAIHNLTLLPSTANITEILLQRIGTFTSAESGSASIVLSRPVLKALQASTKAGNKDQVQRELAEAGLDMCHVQGFVRTMSAPALRLSLQVMVPGRLSAPLFLDLLCDSTYCWAIQSLSGAGEQDDKVQLASVTLAQLEAMLGEMIDLGRAKNSSTLTISSVAAK